VWKVKYKEDGSEKLSDPSYYSSFESLLRALLEEALKLSDVVTIKQLYREHQKLKQELNALLAVS
jgi:flagellar biosynthesis component FlhA